MRTLAVAASICCGLMELTLAAEADAATRKPTLISAQLLEPALHMLATERNIQVVYQSEVVGDRRTAGAAGNLTAQEALVQLLRDTGLTFQYLDGSTVTIVPVASVRTSESGEPSEAGKRGMSSGSASANRAHLAQLDQEKSAPAGAEERPARVELEEVVVGVPEVLVRGSQSINADIRRTRDDMQPYVTYDAQQIQRSSSRNLQEFLNTRLPMNTQQGAQSLVNPVNGDRSSINLRGLGSNQTLILVDGRRMPNFNDSGAFGQPDINAIPLATIERIEILPATASGIYGGGATGGVINIITRKDYSGGDVSLAYGNTTRTDSAEERVEATYGFNLEGGRTHVLLSGSYKATDGLLTGDRDFAARGRQRQFANNPAAFFTGTTPIAGATSNIRSQSGANLQLKPALGGTNLDSPVTYIPTGYSGIASDNGAARGQMPGSTTWTYPPTFWGLARPSFQRRRSARQPRICAANSANTSVPSPISRGFATALAMWARRASRAPRRLASMRPTILSPRPSTSRFRSLV